MKQVNCACIVAFFFITILERLHVLLQVSVNRRFTLLNGQDVHSGVVLLSSFRPFNYILFNKDLLFSQSD